jgi:Cu/Ag efflux pump CusA
MNAKLYYLNVSFRNYISCSSNFDMSQNLKEDSMRKSHILILLGLSTVFFTAGLLLLPQLRNAGEKGKSVSEAILESARTRLRPVLMTSVSTAIGDVPLKLEAVISGLKSR